MHNACLTKENQRSVKKGGIFSAPWQLSIYCLSASYKFTLYYLIWKNRHGPLKFFFHLLFSKMLSFVRRCWKDTVGGRCGSWFCGVSPPPPLPPLPALLHLSSTYLPCNSFANWCVKSAWLCRPERGRHEEFPLYIRGVSWKGTSYINRSSITPSRPYLCSALSQAPLAEGCGRRNGEAAGNFLTFLWTDIWISFVASPPICPDSLLICPSSQRPVMTSCWGWSLGLSRCPAGLPAAPSPVEVTSQSPLFLGYLGPD